MELRERDSRKPMELRKDPVPEAVATPTAEETEDERGDEEPDGECVGLCPPDDADETTEKKPTPEADRSAARIPDVRGRGLRLARGVMVVA